MRCVLIGLEEVIGVRDLVFFFCSGLDRHLIWDLAAWVIGCFGHFSRAPYSFRMVVSSVIIKYTVLGLIPTESDRIVRGEEY